MDVENEESAKSPDNESSKNRIFLCIEYPGFVQDVDKAFETLGGIEKITQVHNDVSKRLELQWRVHDIYSKPVTATRKTTFNILMKVKRSWKKSDPDNKQISAELLGPITMTYLYEGICDFQYLPMEHEGDGSYRSLTESLFINKPLNIAEYISKDAAMFLPPISFSRFEKPGDIMFRRSNLGVKMKDDGNEYDICNTESPATYRHIIAPARKKRPHFTQFLNFSDLHVPSEPKDGAAKLIGEKDSLLVKRVTKMFEERPSWTKPAILAESQMSLDEAKYILPYVAYYWISGPWRKTWTRIGYDPRKDVLSKMYQVVDFRHKQGMLYKDSVIPKKTHGRNTSAHSSIRTKMIHDNEETFETEKYQDDSYTFKPDTMPPCRQVYYQICDIKLPAIQQLVSKNNGKEVECTEKDGWCLPETIQMCRELLWECVEALENDLRPGTSK